MQSRPKKSFSDALLMYKGIKGLPGKLGVLLFRTFNTMSIHATHT